MPLYLLNFFTFTCHWIAFSVQWLCKMTRRLDFRTILIVYLLFIIISLFCVVMQMRENGDLWRVETYFESPVSEIESESMTDVLSIFVDLLNKNNLTYMMYGGTLLGSYRHMGRVPWDDDMDILIDLNQRSRLIRVLESLRPDYDLYIADSPTSERSGKWKFYKTSSKRFKLRPFSWPYVDIFFYRDNGTHLIDAEDGDSYPRSRIFPLHLRPFGSLWLNAPCDIEYVLADIEMNKCMSRSFSHYMEVPIFSWSQRTVACSRLYHLFPFVQRHPNNSATRGGPVSELLKIGTYTLRRETVHRPHCLYNQKM